MRRVPPALACDACGVAGLEWVDASGRGAVWSACEFHQLYFKGFAAELPSTVAPVQLEEELHPDTNLTEMAFEGIRIGVAVEAVFEAVTKTVPLVEFRQAFPQT